MTNQSKKRKFLATTLTASMVAAAVAPVAGAAAADVKTFPDVPADHAYAQVISDMANAGIVKGEPNGNFNLGGKITRAEAAQMTAGLLSLKTGAEANVTKFEDVKGDVWYTGAINSLVDKGVIAGVTEKTFEPGSNITRGQLAQLLVVAYGLEDVNVDEVELPFTDVEKGSWYEKPIKILYSEGLIKGQTEKLFAPKADMKRGDFAWLAANVDYVHGNKLPKPEVVTEISSVNVINKTTVEVKFGSAVDEVSASNFSIEGATVSSAKLADDKKTVTLTVSGLSYGEEYTLAANKVLVDGEEQDFGTKTFQVPAVTDIWDLVVEPAASELHANGADNTKVTFKLVDKATGQPDANADDIVLSVKTTHGALANERITIQDGVAEVLLTSEFSNKNVTAKIDAQIIEASGDYSELIGKAFGSATVLFKVEDGTVETKTLVSAESNQADRLTLFFDQTVVLTDFVKVDKFGNLLYNYDSNGDGKVEVDSQGNPIERTADFVPAGATAYHALKDESVKVKQGTKGYTVQGLRPVAGNLKAMEVILANPNKIGTQLTDNEKVSVETNIKNSINQVTKSTADFVLTDARNPEVTSATAQGMYEVVVKFSEAVADGNFRFDGLASSDNSLRNKSANENVVELGEFDAITLQDTRDTATITLTDKYDWDGPSKNEAIPGYFKAGQHSIQISELKDHAHATDSQNMGTTQTLQFVVKEDTKRPEIAAVTESPEQFRVSFDRQLRQNIVDVEKAVKLQIFDEKSKEWYNVDGTSTNGKHPDLKTNVKTFASHVGGGQYVVETDTDWTVAFDTKSTNKNYYNYEFRLFVDKEHVSNKANGLVNEVALIADLNKAGSHLLTNDTTSPVIDDIVATTSNSTYRVLMSEPVKLPGLDNAGETLNQDQSKLPAPTVQFQGKDKDGKTVTFSGKINGYSDANSTKADSEFYVTWTANEKGETPQDVVDAGGSTNWTVIVKAISDDVGNTAATLTERFDISKTPESTEDFYIIAAEHAVAKDGETKDKVTLTFTSGVAHTGGSYDATALSQYTLNGKTLPTGTSIAVEDRDAVSGNETVVISLPKGYLEATNTITVNKNLVSAKGVKLIGKYEWVTTPGTGLEPIDPPTDEGSVSSLDGRVVLDPVTQRYIVRVPVASVDTDAESLQITVDGVVYTLTAAAGKDYFEARGIKADSTKDVEDAIVTVKKAETKTISSADGRVVLDPVTQRYIVRVPVASFPEGTSSLEATIEGATYTFNAAAGKDYFEARGIKAANVSTVEDAKLVAKK